MAISTLRSRLHASVAAILSSSSACSDADLVVVGIGVGPHRHHLVVAIDDRLHRGDAVHDVALDVLGRIELRLLGEVADGETRRQSGLTAVAVVEAGHDPQQARLAGAVGAEHADLGAGVERQRDVLQHRAVGRVDAGELVTGVDEFVGHGVAQSTALHRWVRPCCGATFTRGGQYERSTKRNDSQRNSTKEVSTVLAVDSFFSRAALGQFGFRWLHILAGHHLDRPAVLLQPRAGPGVRRVRRRGPGTQHRHRQGGAQGSVVVPLGSHQHVRHGHPDHDHHQGLLRQRVRQAGRWHRDHAPACCSARS